MGAYVFEVLMFVVFTALAAVVPYVRRKRGYWTRRGISVAPERRAFAATLPGIRLNDRSLARYRDEAEGAAVLGLHDAGRPCALACDVRVAAAAMGNDGFAGVDADEGRSLIPSAVDAEGMVAVLPTMVECVGELTTSLEAVANRRQIACPWTEVKKCAATVVATCVYGQPMVDSRIKAFAEQCDRALSSTGSSGRPTTITDYFASYDLSSDGRGRSADVKRLLRTAAAERDKIDSDVADKQVRLDMFEFVMGSIEPTAALVTAALYELARDQNVQNQLRKHLDSELDEHQQQVTIEQLDRLPYLENVLRETLRKYPLTTAVRRVTTKSYSVGNVTLEPDTLTVVPVYAFHHDHRHFAKPEEFQPHRFPSQLSSAYMPHGAGPRSYIGKHFVGLEAKLIIAMLVSRYEVHVDDGVPDPFDLGSFSGVRVRLANRSNVRESTLSASLRKLRADESGDKKFLFF